MSEAGWPTRTDWDKKAQQRGAQRWGEDKGLTEKATKQRAAVEREKRRVPDEPTPDETRRELKIARSRLRRFWRNVSNTGRCSACGSEDALIEIEDWLNYYETYRCRFCLNWEQIKIPDSGRPVNFQGG